MTSITISKQEFEEVKDDLKSDLIEELETEVEFAEFETDKKGLWDTPAVDSKAVVKLSPTIQKYTGKKLDPTWIKCGGYDSVVDAVEHIMEQLELEFQSN